LLTDAQQVTRRWKDYMEDLYNAKNKPSEVDIEPTKQVTFDNIGPFIIRE